MITVICLIAAGAFIAVGLVEVRDYRDTDAIISFILAAAFVAAAFI